MNTIKSYKFTITGLLLLLVLLSGYTFLIKESEVGVGNDNLTPIQNIFMQGNNINTVFRTDGIMNYDWVTFPDKDAGMIWPAGSPVRMTINYASGFWVGAKVVLGANQKELRLAAAMYTSHYTPGNIPVVGGVPPASVCNDPKWRGYYVQLTDPFLENGGTRLKIAGGRQYTFDFDPWSLWPVQLGAPYVEVNGIAGYQPGWNSDRPGIGGCNSKPDEILFMVYMDYTNCTDSLHASELSLPGGSLPLGAEIHQLTYMFNYPPLRDMYFIKWKVINKSGKQWDSTYFGFADDIDIGAGVQGSKDDGAGCDTLRDIGFLYNADNNDVTYGSNPPAIGYRILQGPLKYTGNSGDTAKLPYGTLVGYKILGMTSFYSFISAPPDPCLSDPDDYLSGYNFLRGLDGCGRVRLNPITGQPTTFQFTGDACSRIGWYDSLSHDTRYILGSGPITMNSLDTQIIVMGAIIGFGGNNFQNICNMLGYSDSAKKFHFGNLGNSISGQVRYRDNNYPVSSGYVKALKYDVNTETIIVVDSAVIGPDGHYTLNRCPVDSLDIMAYQNSEEDFVPTYYESTIDWRNAAKVYPITDLENIDILVFRMQKNPGLQGMNGLGGKVLSLNNQGLKDAYVYVKQEGVFIDYGITNSSGSYRVASMIQGAYDIVVNRMGYCSANSAIIFPPKGVDTLNFRLCRVSIGNEKDPEKIPQGYRLYQNYPNPFNAGTRIGFDIPSSVNVTLVIYDLLGREITRLLDNDFKPAGSYSVQLDAANFSSGVYFYRIEALHTAPVTGNFIESKKMVVIK